MKNKPSEYPELFRTIIRFSVPLMLANILQLVYNTADTIVVGRFSGSNSLAAVGSTTSIIFLLITLFSGIAIGANYLVAHYYGAENVSAVSETVHCAALLSVILGIAAGATGFFLSVPLLELTSTPPDVLALASIYLKIYFLGVPALVVYNFGSAILRAVGDTRYPLFIMIISGTLNVGLNLLLVIVFHLDVAGVAIATSVSELVSAVMVTVRLCQSKDSCRLTLRKIRYYPDKAFGMLRIGIAAGLQGIVFSISNVLIQSVVNTFGAAAVAGNSAASSLEGFIYTAQNSFYQATVTYTSQSVGAKRYDRITKIFRVCLSSSLVLGLALCALLYVCQDAFLRIYIKPGDFAFDAVMLVGVTRILMVSRFQWLGGMMEVACGSIRGMGKALSPTLVTLIGACGLRILWVYFAYAFFGTLSSLYVVYPVSWAVTFVAQLVLLQVYRKRPPFALERGVV